MSSFDHCGAAMRAAAAWAMYVRWSLPSGTSLGIMPLTFCVLKTVPGARSKWGTPARCSRGRTCRPRLRRLAIPQNAVARRVRHRSSAAEFVEETAGAGALAERHGRLLVFEELHTRAAGLRECLEKRFWTVQFVQRDIARAARRQRDDDLGDQSGWAGQPGMLITGRPIFERKSGPR